MEANDENKGNEAPLFAEEKERTYLDDFSEILSDLENQSSSKNDGGDKQ